MTSKPASRSARATIFAPRSWPSSPGLATTIRYVPGMRPNILGLCDAPFPRSVPPARPQALDARRHARPLPRPPWVGLGHRAPRPRRDPAGLQLVLPDPDATTGGSLRESRRRDIVRAAADDRP